MGNQKNNQSIRIVRGSDRYAGAPDTDLSIQIPLENSKKSIIEGDRNVLINLEERFDHERQISTKFRIAGKIVNLFDNTVSGRCSNYAPFEEELYYIDPTQSLVVAQGNVANAVWTGYPPYDEFNFFRTSGVPGHVDYDSKSASTYNWSVYLSYSHKNDYNQFMKYTDDDTNNSLTFNVSDGIPYSIKNRTVNGKRMISFYCGFKHNIKEGDYVYLQTPVNGKNLLEVYSLGDQSYGNEDKILNVYNYGYTGNSISDGAMGTLKRVINPSNSGETMSEYYVRKHKTLTEVKNVDLTRMGFEQNNFPVEKKLEYSALTPNQTTRISVKDGRGSFGLSFDKDIDIISLMDNLDRPVTELFVTIVNKGYMGFFNHGGTGPPNKGLEVGWSFNFRKSMIDTWWSKLNLQNKDNITTDYYDKPGDNNLNIRFYYNKDLPIGTEIKGDICEWNKFDQKETILSKISHKYSFNPGVITTSGNVNLPDGYTYNPHHSVKLRVYSDYIETGDREAVSGVPDYSFFSNFEGQWRWRDIYTYGYIDTDGNGVNYPFLNGEHYPFADVLFLQTPLMRNNNVFNDIIFDPITDDCE
tara:strand:- start:7264 stop:9012 length:1749 start_codon:yes stop_codon:yes gene_type:complete